ncbi:hypothetical protein ACFQU7_13090 [Pseudoroseomonas wenyumeiae]
MTRGRRRQGVVDAPRHVDTVRPEVVERRRGQRQDLHVQPGLIHQGQPILGEVEQPVLDDAGMHRHARVGRFQADGVPCIPHFGREEVLFDTDQFHCCHLLAFQCLTGAAWAVCAGQDDSRYEGTAKRRQTHRMHMIVARSACAGQPDRPTNKPWTVST